MAIEVLYVDKLTNTLSETLVAFALAHVVNHLVPHDVSDLDIRIEDRGNCYCVVARPSLQEGWIDRAKFIPLLRGLDTAKKRSDLPHAIDYTMHQVRNEDFFSGREKKLSEEQMQELGLVPPDRNWPVWAVVNQMSATDAYNKLARLWEMHREIFPDLLRIIFELYGQLPNDEEAAAHAWSKLAKANKIRGSKSAPQLQVVNPGRGKGGNSSKASGLGIGGLKGFWVPEYLKFVGLYICALPRSISNSKDRKTYVLRPKELSWDTHNTVFSEFQKRLYASTAIKMDVLATLQYCLTYLKQWRDAYQKGRSRIIKSRPGDHVAALEAVFYKHLGSAFATMNVSTLVLPEWVPTIETVADADRFIDLLSEHEAIVRNLNEDKGDEYSLLQTYRTFLSSRDLVAFYRFTQGYATHVMRSYTGKGFPARRFQITNLEALIMAHDPTLAEIVQNTGFRRVAAAIRESTVRGQYLKTVKTPDEPPDPYTVRYGLGNNLLRHASYPRRFIQELCKFVHAYAQENERVRALHNNRPPRFRVALTDDDLEQIVQLISKSDSETVAHLLVAFGYARRANGGGPEAANKQEIDPEAQDQ